MGLVRTRISLTNPRRSDLDPVEVDALVDSGALHLCIPEHIAIQLQLDEFDQREVTIADGSKHLIAYKGPVAIACGKRKCLGGAMVLGSEVLLGAIPMEDMDLVIRPSNRDVIPNPLNPNIPASIAMGERPAERSDRGD
jgi:clan AA aspartic protease